MAYIQSGEKRTQNYKQAWEDDTQIKLKYTLHGQPLEY